MFYWFLLDESDSDVEILREEKNEDLDVIIVAETTVKPVQRLEMGTGGVAGSKSVHSCQGLRREVQVDLSLDDCDDEDSSSAVATPLNLSSKKCSGDDTDLDLDSSSPTMIIAEQTANTFTNFFKESFSSNVKLLSKSDNLCVPSNCDNSDSKTLDPYHKKMDLFESSLMPGPSLSATDLSVLGSVPVPTVIPPNTSVGDIPVDFSSDSDNKQSCKRSLSSSTDDSFNAKKVKKETDLFDSEAWKALDLDFLSESGSSSYTNNNGCDSNQNLSAGAQGGPPATHVITGRSLSISIETSTKHLPPKKQSCFRQASDPGFSAASHPTSPQPSCSSWGSEKCTSCNISLLGFRISRCIQGHPTCAFCLEEQVKLVLTGKTKVQNQLSRLSLTHNIGVYFTKKK